MEQSQNYERTGLAQQNDCNNSGPDILSRRPINAQETVNRIPVGLDDIPPTDSLNGGKLREVSINEVGRGYIVRVGCQTIAISTKAELIAKLVQYINDPSKTEREYNEGKF